MRRFVISVSDQAFDKLAKVADQHRRPIKEQAAWLLERYVLTSGESQDNTPRDTSAACPESQVE
jgi:hypothetical protein